MLSTHEDIATMLHAQWAIHRLAQRFPEAALATFRSVTAEAVSSLRCSLARTDRYAATTFPDARPRSSTWFMISPVSRMRTDASYLLLTTCYGLEKIGSHSKAKEIAMRLEQAVD